MSLLQLSSSQLGLLTERCQDTSPAIRKQAARSLCALLQNDPQSAVLRAAWINGVLPLSQVAYVTHVTYVTYATYATYVT